MDFLYVLLFNVIFNFPIIEYMIISIEISDEYYPFWSYVVIYRSFEVSFARVMCSE